MTEKRFNLHITWLNNDYEEGEAELKDGSQPIALFDNVEDARLVKDLLNELNDTKNELQKENKYLKQELQKIYEIATVNKVRDIVEKVYDDLLYETTDESDYARKNVLKCLEEIDLLRDDLND